MAWCPLCNRRRVVVDEHSESTYDGGYEYGYTVRELDCTHEVSTTPSTVGRSPGAPYAGRPTARSIRASDLAASRRTEETE